MCTTPLRAQEETYTVDYDFNFFIQRHTTDLDVELDITLTNLRSDVYINEYVMRFPRNFFFKNLQVTDEGKTIPYVVAEKNGAKQITFRFREPDEGAFSQNKLTLTYTLENMHTPKGRINEVILPLLVSTDKTRVNATLNLPDEFDRKISISKPVPSNVHFRRIHWDNVDAQTIFALFGESQVYDVQLGYSLQNTGIRPDTQTIALPPETLFQRVYIESLEPQPDRAFTDEDGNYLAEYTVPARSTLDIALKSYVEVFVKPQSSLRDHIRASFRDQEKYLLTEEKQWALGKNMSSVPLQELSTAESIYDYTVDQLSYSLTRLDEDTSRFGAERALSEPLKAVCMEFTDVFIALAREKGIPAREIQGYGYSESRTIRPQSLVLDELHAWPEFYNRQEEVWVQVDPTWEDTSGIDYFTGFDVNHIALAIHGKDPLTPLPAGFYKTARRKDVHVNISSLKPAATTKLDINHSLEKSLVVGETYDSSLSVTNTGNAFVHDLNIVPESSTITVKSGPVHVSYLAPYETVDIPITYTVEENYMPSDTLRFTYDGTVLGSHSVSIVTPIRNRLQTILVFGGGAVILFTIYLFLKRKHA